MIEQLLCVKAFSHVRRRVSRGERDVIEHNVKLDDSGTRDLVIQALELASHAVGIGQSQVTPVDRHNAEIGPTTNRCAHVKSLDHTFVEFNEGLIAQLLPGLGKDRFGDLAKRNAQFLTGREQSVELELNGAFGEIQYERDCMRKTEFPIVDEIGWRATVTIYEFHIRQCVPNNI